MRPSAWRHSSIARSTAQSECGELSTGTKISRYTGTSRFRAGRVCEALNRLSSYPGTSCLPSESHTRSEEHTSELQSRLHLVCRLLLEKKKRYDQQFILALRS